MTCSARGSRGAFPCTSTWIGMGISSRMVARRPSIGADLSPSGCAGRCGTMSVRTAGLRPGTTQLAETTKRTPRSLALVVLAAGKGTRMKSSLPKVLHPVAGKPILWHVIQAGLAAKPTKIVVVVGHDAELIEAEVRSWDLSPKPVFVVQRPQRGTAHAVQVARKAVGRVSDVVVANGDFDPVTPDDVRALIRSHRRSGAAATLLTSIMDDPGTYGRVIRDARGRFIEIDEDRATPGAEDIDEVATNWIAFAPRALFASLPLIDAKTRQKERYLNRIYPLMRERGERVNAILADTGGAMGANSLAGLAGLERLMRGRINAAHMANGVTLVDPETTYIGADVSIGPGTVIRPMSFLEGATTIGEGCDIGPSTRLIDTEVGDRCRVTFAVANLAVLGDDVDAGPFAYLRAGTELAEGVHVGTYVEIKGSTVGEGSKVPHLSYVGDASIGADTNIGAATVFVNYDGYTKHRTDVGDRVRIGSDTMLVAPVSVGDGAVTGAGSVITKDVPAGALAVARGEQRTVEGYRERQDAKRAAKPRSKTKSKRIAKGQGA
ncbi:MAG TPA: bifunctional UDP-N-acetylglucosamine diphosphorylase/glucosamine-1-phosphate N-acetyltransferase GlmU [Actinomycetota bacterium]